MRTFSVLRSLWNWSVWTIQLILMLWWVKVWLDQGFWYLVYFIFFFIRLLLFKTKWKNALASTCSQNLFCSWWQHRSTWRRTLARNFRSGRQKIITDLYHTFSLFCRSALYLLNLHTWMWLVLRNRNIRRLFCWVLWLMCIFKYKLLVVKHFITIPTFLDALSEKHVYEICNYVTSICNCKPCMFIRAKSTLFKIKWFKQLGKLLSNFCKFFFP